MVPSLGGGRVEAVRFLELTAGGEEPVVQSQVLVIQVYGERAVGKCPRAPSACTYDGGVDAYFVDGAAILGFEGKDGRQGLPVLQRGTACGQVDALEHEGGVAAARRTVDARGGVGIQHVHAVYEGLRLFAAAAAYQQVSAFSLHLCAGQGLQGFVKVAVGTAGGDQFHGMHVAEAAGGGRRLACMHLHFTKGDVFVRQQLQVDGVCGLLGGGRQDGQAAEDEG